MKLCLALPMSLLLFCGPGGLPNQVAASAELLRTHSKDQTNSGQQDHSQVATALASWLSDIGLGHLLEVTGSLDLREPDRSSSGAKYRLAEAAAAAAVVRADPFSREPKERAQERVTALTEQINSTGDITWPPSLRRADRPLLVVSLRPKKNDGVLAATNRAFEKTHSLSLWERILQRISILDGLSARAIVLYVDDVCDYYMFLRLVPKYTVEQGGWGCTVGTSGTASTPIPIVVNVGSSGVAKAPTSSVDLSVAVPKVLSKLGQSATLDFLSTEPEFVEVIVRGARGIVIAGGSDWERLQLTIAVTGSTLRVTVDGRLASGLGGYPRDSQFTRDMEPQYSLNLTEYAKRLANRLRDQLVKP